MIQEHYLHAKAKTIDSFERCKCHSCSFERPKRKKKNARRVTGDDRPNPLSCSVATRTRVRWYRTIPQVGRSHHPGFRLRIPKPAHEVGKKKQGRETHRPGEERAGASRMRERKSVSERERERESTTRDGKSKEGERGGPC